MLSFKLKKAGAMALTLALALITTITPVLQVKAADHAESTSVAGDPGARGRIGA